MYVIMQLPECPICAAWQRAGQAIFAYMITHSWTPDEIVELRKLMEEPGNGTTD